MNQLTKLVRTKKKHDLKEICGRKQLHLLFYVSECLWYKRKHKMWEMSTLLIFINVFIKSLICVFKS